MPRETRSNIPELLRPRNLLTGLALIGLAVVAIWAPQRVATIPPPTPTPYATETPIVTPALATPVGPSH